jgi:lipopolysaccharide transport system ATP-binding protein
MNNAIEIENLSKKYTISEREKYLTLRDIVVKAAKVPGNLLKGKKFKEKGEFWALKDINFTVKEGEVIGIIGRNGAGKSTLLKVLSRITEPTHGVIKLNGRVSSLLEVGTGFHPELTGRENIYLNGAILGMSRKEIDLKIEEIIAFSGVEKFIDMPVKRYSSGMQVRLAFSVVAHLEPDILIIDEVLAVGDAEFQKKCLGKMDEVTHKAGRTILFVSHDMGAIQRLCEKTIWLDNGQIKEIGDTDSVVRSYISFSTQEKPLYVLENDLNKEVKVVKVSITNKDGQNSNVFDVNEEFFIDIEYYVNQDDTIVHTAVIVDNSFGSRIFSSESSEKHPQEFKPKKKGLYKARFKFPQLKGMYLYPGNYFFRISAGLPNNRPWDSVSDIMINFKMPEKEIDVVSVSGRNTAVNISGEWTV